ncbi:MAG: hypothetical protein ACTSXE_02605 [Candidatus Thorarchaeota archaeon]
MVGLVVLMLNLPADAEAAEIIPDGEGGVWIMTGWYEDLIIWIHIKINDPNIIYCFADS